MKHEENVWSHHDPIWLRKKRNRNESRPMTNDTTRGAPRTPWAGQDPVQGFLKMIQEAEGLPDGTSITLRLLRPVAAALASPEARGEGLTEEQESVLKRLELGHEIVTPEIVRELCAAVRRLDALRLRPQAAREWDASSMLQAPDGLYQSYFHYWGDRLQGREAIISFLATESNPERWRFFGPMPTPQPIPASPQKEG